MNRTPDYFLVGAPKCGTTSVYHYLRQHPEIFLPRQKSLYYFCPDVELRPASTRIATEDRYLSLFADAGDEKWIGEATDDYLFSDPLLFREVGPRQMPVDLRRRLLDEFRQEIDEVSELVGRDLGHCYSEACVRGPTRVAA